MQKSIVAALFTVAFSLPLACQAQDIYMKVQAGQSDYHDTGDHIRPTAFLLGAGLSLSKIWDVEAGYIRFGMAKDASTDIDSTTTTRFQTQAIYVAGVGNVEIASGLSAFGKAGVSLNRSTFESVDTLDGRLAHSKVKPTLLVGAGLSYQFNKELAGLIEYSYYGRVSDDPLKVSMTTVGLRYNY